MPSSARTGDGRALPVVLVTTEDECQILAEGSRAPPALDLALQRLEVADGTRAGWRVA